MTIKSSTHEFVSSWVARNLDCAQSSRARGSDYEGPGAFNPEAKAKRNFCSNDDCGAITDPGFAYCPTCAQGMDED